MVDKKAAFAAWATTRRKFLSLLGRAAAGASVSATLGGSTFAAEVHQKNHGGGMSVLRRGEEGYETKRKNLVWQAIKPKRYPERIYEITSDDDIPAALAEARAGGYSISIVGGGHSYVGYGVQDGKAILDLSRLQGVDIDAKNRVAHVQPALISIEFDHLLDEKNLAFPVAHCATVAMGGYLLGGGMGWNAESWNNLACFNVRSVDVVLASGQRVTASAENHPDLFWAARGGGPLFCGVATRFHVDIFSRPAAVYGSTYVYEIEAAPGVVTWMEKARLVQDRKVEMVLIFATAPPDENSATARRQCIVSAVCFADDLQEARRLLDVIAEGAPDAGLVFKEEVQETSISKLYSEDKSNLPIRQAVETAWTDDVVAASRCIIDNFNKVPSEKTVIYFNYRSRPTLPEDAAYSAMGKAFMLSMAMWSNAADDEANILWSDNLMQDLQPVRKAVYINETELVRHPERARHAFSPRNWKKLKEVAAKYDPTGMFASPFF